MPWYRIYASHGPGHQSNYEDYFYFERPLTKAAKQLVWEGHAQPLNWPVGGVERVKGLPAHILESKIVGAEAAIREHTALLEVLKKHTPSIPVIAVRLAPDGVWKAGKRDQKMPFSARLLSDPAIEVYGATRDKAVNLLVRSLNKWNRTKEYRRKNFAVITR
jgi:hypothetical protein